jgi:hypothetical protein
MTSFRSAVPDLRFVGQDLARPGCVVTTASGDGFGSEAEAALIEEPALSARLPARFPSAVPLVEPMGLEPTTSTVQTSRSPN